MDKDPAGYIERFPAPQYSEDQYLLGRAYLLTGDYVKARAALTAARDKLADADPANAGVLRNDIAVLLGVTNNAAMQADLKKETEAAAPPTANGNANR